MDIKMLSFILVSIAIGFSSAADLDYMNQTLRNYFADTRHHQVNIEYKARAKRFIFDEFQRLGLEATYHEFTYQEYNFSNVIGIKKGANFGSTRDKILGVVAHYDTVSTSKGVDDNGAGVVAMLEVASQLKDAETDHTIIFLSSDLEETLLTGSEKFVYEWIPSWVQKHYDDIDLVGRNAQGCIVMDTMMEYNTSANSQLIPGSDSQFQLLFPEAYFSVESDSFQGDFLALIYRTSSDQAIANAFKTSWASEGRNEFELESFPLPEPVDLALSDFLRSDHANFWDASIPAVFITDSANFRGDMIQCYHESCDNLEVMLTENNLNFLGKTAESIVRTVKRLSTVSSGMDRKQACIGTLTLTAMLVQLFTYILM